MINGKVFLDLTSQVVKNSFKKERNLRISLYVIFEENRNKPQPINQINPWRDLFKSKEIVNYEYENIESFNIDLKTNTFSKITRVNMHTKAYWFISKGRLELHIFLNLLNQEIG